MCGYIKAKTYGTEQYLILETNLKVVECLIYKINGNKALYNWLSERLGIVSYEDLIANSKGYLAKSENKLFVLYRL